MINNSFILANVLLYRIFYYSIYGRLLFHYDDVAVAAIDRCPVVSPFFTNHSFYFDFKKGFIL